jgi:glucose-1-phosphate thymidylyltransferase
LRGPLVIGRNAVVENSFIGPSSAIGDGCEIINSEVEHSVIMERSRILDITRLEDSLIGREAEVTRSQRRPRALRLMIGDHCQIDTE